MRIYTDQTQGAEHIALVKGDLVGRRPVLVRMHAFDPLLDLVGAGPQGRAHEFQDAMRLIAAEGAAPSCSCATSRCASHRAEASPQTLRQYGLGRADPVLAGAVAHRAPVQQPQAPRRGPRGLRLEITGTRKIAGGD
jgi:3,4-dihydroxy 2-butanone 4-phosphate synthase/GTP cyclohydrolase II